MHSSPQGMTVVVPTLNRGAYLRDALRDLVAQNHRPLEILVVDQSSADDPELRALIASHADVITYHHVDFRGLPLARNFGWQNARYEAILFVDDDIRCGPALVGEHIRILTRDNVGMVAGGIDERTPSGRHPSRPGHFNFWTAAPARGFDATGECVVSHVPGGNFSAWRAVLQQAGGFDEALATGAALYEETEFCLRVRNSEREIIFNGDARLLHLAAGSGGCRVPDIVPYIGSLAHNRAVVICRHLRWFHKLTALPRLFLLVTTYAVHYRNAGVFAAAWQGFLKGRQSSKRSPVCTEHRTATSCMAVQA